MPELFTAWTTVAKDIGIVTSIVSPPIYALWRLVIKKHVYLPAVEFHANVTKAVATIERIEPVVILMAENIGPNGGGALLDQVKLIGARVVLLIDDLPWPTFEASGTGHNTRVNHMFERAFGYSAADLVGNGWKNLLHPDDAEDYLEAWSLAVSDVRQFRYASVRFVTKDRHTMQVTVNASPVVDHGLTVWMGTVRINGLDINYGATS